MLRSPTWIPFALPLAASVACALQDQALIAIAGMPDVMCRATRTH